MTNTIKIPDTNSCYRILIVVVVILLTTGCQWQAAYHKYFMSGQVVEVDQGRVVACVANIEHVQRGTVLLVYRITMISEFDDFDDVEHHWEREKVGEIVVDSLVDEHFISATIMQGDIRQHDVVSSQ